MRFLKKWFWRWWNVSYEHFGETDWRRDEPADATRRK